MGRYIKELYQFLNDIRVNNNRDWFARNRDRYDTLRALWLADIDRLTQAMAAWEPGMAAQDGKSCAYRFYRDTRFSSDKSPYKTFFSALLSPMGRKTTKAAWYLHMGPEPQTMTGSGIYGGCWCPDGAMLRKLRRAIVDNSEEWNEITNAPELTRYYPGWAGNKLKTIPQGWPKDHPMAEVLRLKDIGKYCPEDENFFMNDNWPELASERMRILKPLIDFLNYSIDE